MEENKISYLQFLSLLGKKIDDLEDEYYNFSDEERPKNKEIAVANYEIY